MDLNKWKGSMKDLTKSQNLKKDLLDAYRAACSDIRPKTAKVEPEDASKIINKCIDQTKKAIIKDVQPLLKDLDKKDALNLILHIHYCSYVAMIDERNRVWEYDYMALSRRVGELWDPFCQLCWEYPVDDSIEFWEPPHFDEVKMKVQKTILKLIDENVSDANSKKLLLSQLDVMWEFISSGEIQLSSDLHFQKNKTKYTVDFKSGFNSNEKGNTNRLLTVASIYKSLGPEYECVLLVRSGENNNYLQTLKNSNLWKVYTGNDTYEAIQSYTNFNLQEWIRSNVNWVSDLSPETSEAFRKKDLIKYLKW